MANSPFKTNRLAICEGVEDAAFVRALIKRRTLGAFDVRATEDLGNAPGITGFKDAIISSVAVRGFRNINRIVLIADSDQHWRYTFRKVRNQVTDANRDTDVAGRFSFPTEPFTLSGGNPRLMIYLMPGPSSKGALETLLWTALTSTTATGYTKATDCSEAACLCAGINTGSKKWPQSKLDKARVRIGLALLNRKNPAVGLGIIWKQYPNLISLNHSAFDHLVETLTNI